MGTGNNDSERICWLRLRGLTYNLFIVEVEVYMSHSIRVQSDQTDTLKQLGTICKQVKQGDCLVILGDFNVQLSVNVLETTDKYVCARGNRMKQLKSYTSWKTTTYLPTIPNLGSDSLQPHIYIWLHKGQQEFTTNITTNIKTERLKWFGREKMYMEKFSENYTVQLYGGEYDLWKWKVKFDDGYVKSYPEAELVVIHKRETQGKQLDYILVSNLWLTRIEDTSVKWGPSEHRNIYDRTDRTLVYVWCKWIWKIQTSKPTPHKDFGVLGPQTPEPKLNWN